jgi:ATP-binding cassette subfamily F protein uup
MAGGSGETIKLGYYAKRNQSKPGQRVIDVIKEYGEFIPLMKGKMISASQLLERFLLMLKNNTILWIV